MSQLKSEECRTNVPKIFFILSEKNLANIQDVDGKKRITFEKLECGCTKLGDLAILLLPDGTRSIGKVVDMANVPKTIKIPCTNQQIRFVLEIFPD